MNNIFNKRRNNISFIFIISCFTLMIACSTLKKKVFEDKKKLMIDISFDEFTRKFSIINSSKKTIWLDTCFSINQHNGGFSTVKLSYISNGYLIVPALPHSELDHDVKCVYPIDEKEQLFIYPRIGEFLNNNSIHRQNRKIFLELQIVLFLDNGRDTTVNTEFEMKW